MPSPEIIRYHINHEGFDIVLSKGKLNPGAKKSYDLGNFKVFIRRPKNVDTIYLSIEGRSSLRPEAELGMFLSSDTEIDLTVDDLPLGGFPVNVGEKVILEGEKTSLDISNT